MRLPLARFAVKEVVVGTLLLGSGASVGFWLYWPIGVVCLAGLAGWLLFFRDPDRSIPNRNNVLLSPADGKIADVEQVTESEFIEGPAWRIGIFLSVFDVHINRAPCSGRVEYLHHRCGRFHAAFNDRAAEENEAQSMGLIETSQPGGKLLIRQIAGVLARRIVCPLSRGDALKAGQRFGMIKFGSRTELWIPVHEGIQLEAKVGQRVRAGRTVLASYKE